MGLKILLLPGKRIGAEGTLAGPPVTGVDMSTPAQFHEQADFLRESSGSRIEATLRKAVRVLARFRIPHFVCGGFAVQEHGYPRFTQDVDIIVPDVGPAYDTLCTNGFLENPGATVTDPETRLKIDLRPGGQKLDSGPLQLPLPTMVSEEPQILTLEALIGTKLSAYVGRGIERVKDYADVVELMKANQLPRGYGVAAGVRDFYQRIWDELQANRLRGTLHKMDRMKILLLPGDGIGSGCGVDRGVGKLNRRRWEATAGVGGK
jgi:hypothetical protein